MWWGNDVGVIQTRVPARTCGNCFAKSPTRQLFIFSRFSMYSSTTAVGKMFPFIFVYSVRWSVLILCPSQCDPLYGANVMNRPHPQIASHCSKSPSKTPWILLSVKTNARWAVWTVQCGCGPLYCSCVGWGCWWCVYKINNSKTQPRRQ